MVSDINLSPAVSRQWIFLHSLKEIIDHFATKYDTPLIMGILTLNQIIPCSRVFLTVITFQT